MKNPTLRKLLREVLRPGYLVRARARSRRHRTAWDLLALPLALPCMGLLTYGGFWLMWRLHTWVYPGHAGRLREFWSGPMGFMPFVSSFLLLIPLLFASIPLGMMVANCVLRCIGPARRAFDRKFAGPPGGAFREAMAELAVATLLIVPVCILLSLIGALTLRNLR